MATFKFARCRPDVNEISRLEYGKGPDADHMSGLLET
jgi:hypothetical protein